MIQKPDIFGMVKPIILCPLFQKDGSENQFVKCVGLTLMFFARLNPKTPFHRI